MSRSDYDDMPTSFKRNKRGGGRKSYIFALMGVLIILIVVIVMMVFKGDGEEEVVDEKETTMNVDVPEVEEVVVEVPAAPAPQVEEKEPVVEPESEPEPETAVEAEAPSEPAAENTEETDGTAEKAEEEKLYEEWTVRESDTLQLISSETGISADTLASINRIADQNALQPGEIIYIPPQEGRLYKTREGDTVEVVMQRFNVSIPAEEFLSLNLLESEDISAKEYLFIPEDGEVASNPFVRPCFGEIDMVFGEMWEDERLEGVTFSLTPGAAVVAIADGIVTDAGTDMDLGRFITIMHEDGYRSTYWCLEMTNVKLGQTVRKGDVIATVGSSSRHFGPAKLYFTLSQGPVNLDPLLFF